MSDSHWCRPSGMELFASNSLFSWSVHLDIVIIADEQTAESAQDHVQCHVLRQDNGIIMQHSIHLYNCLSYPYLSFPVLILAIVQLYLCTALISQMQTQTQWVSALYFHR